MRRLVAALVLTLVLPVVPADAERPGPPRVPLVEGGAFSIAPVARGEELPRRLEPLAVTPESKLLLQQVARASVASHDGDFRIALPFEAPDLDGDGSSELLVYDTEFDIVDHRYLRGHTTLAVHDGRTGRLLWRRTFGIPVAIFHFVKVGTDRGRPGIVLTSVGEDLATNSDLRVVSLGGARGETLFDRSVTSADGLGEVHFGGFLDAVPNGGTDLLIARTQYIGMSSSITVVGTRWPQADLSQVFVVDGRNGRLFQGSERMLGLGGWVGFAAGGDYDRDNRDDFLIVRWGLRGRGTVTARSLTEDRVLWTNDSVPLGNQVLLHKPDADIVGDRRDDVFFQTRTTGGPLLSVPGVTDEMTLFAHDANGTHAIVLDGLDGTTEVDRWDGDSYLPLRDVDRNGKADILVLDVFVDERRGGVRFSAGAGSGSDIYTREVSLPVDAPLLAGAGAGVIDAGDVDGDGIGDFWYEVAVGATSVTMRRTKGFLLARNGRTLTTTDYPLGGSLDGRGTDRYGWVASGDGGENFFFRDGLTGRSYWRTFGRTDKLTLLGFVPVHGARGRRCANLVAVSVGYREREGEIWGVGLDGRTGRVVWSRALNDMPDRPVVAPRGGASAPCG